MEKPLDKTLTEFMGVTAKSKVAVVVPLYGFWGDVPDNPVNCISLQIALSRLYSYVHQLYVVFVAHPESLPREPAEYEIEGKKKVVPSVIDQLMGWAKGGNVVNVPVNREATYTEYVAEGIARSLEDTDAQFIMVFNPWVLIQEGAIDKIVDRCNRSDEAKVVSGFDLRSLIEPDNFDQYNNTMPAEEIDLSFNFMAMPRYVAEMAEIDRGYLTHVFAERDMWQQVMQRSFTPITSQRVPIFPFEFPWGEYELREDIEHDRQKFVKKWQFDPGIIWGDPDGATRKDR